MYGTAAIGSPPRTIHGFLPEFEERLGAKYSADQRGTVADIARELGEFYAEQWHQLGMPNPGNGLDPMVFLTAGFNEGEAYGRMYEVVVPTATAPVEQTRERLSALAGVAKVSWSIGL